MPGTRKPDAQTVSALAAALQAAALSRADAFARWAARPRGVTVCAGILALVVACLAGAMYGIETAGATAAVVTCMAAALAAFATWVVWERRRERGTRSVRRRRVRRGRRGA